MTIFVYLLKYCNEIRILSWSCEKIIVFITIMWQNSCFCSNHVANWEFCRDPATNSAFLLRSSYEICVSSIIRANSRFPLLSVWESHLMHDFWRNSCFFCDFRMKFETNIFFKFFSKVLWRNSCYCDPLKKFAYFLWFFDEVRVTSAIQWRISLYFQIFFMKFASFCNLLINFAFFCDPVTKFVFLSRL